MHNTTRTRCLVDFSCRFKTMSMTNTKGRLHISMKYGIQIYHKNIEVMFDFVYDQAMCDRVMSLELRKVTTFAFSLSL